MATSASYFDLVREMRGTYNHRLRLVESVKERGIKPTARLFATSTLTVRKWWCYQNHDPWGLKEHSRAPHRHPFKTSDSRIQQHLDHHGVSLSDLVWQTDNSGEFKGDFPKVLGDSQHVRVLPAAYTYQSDVATVHHIEEDDFLARVHTYQIHFKLVRPNSHKENLST